MKWLLKVELNGEWEECRFSSREEALIAFTALANDYAVYLNRAILFSPTGAEKETDPAGKLRPRREYIN